MLHILKKSNKTLYQRYATSLARRFGSSKHEDAHHGVAANDHHDEDDHGHHGHHHVKEYDWRDDPKYNKDLYLDVRDIGWDPTAYKFPYEGREDWNLPFPPTRYNLDDVSINIRPENRKYILFPAGTMRATYWNPDADMAHEADYESEDLDFQPEDVKTQHFKKKGPIWGWIIIGNLFFIFFTSEFFYQHYPDEDHWKVPRPPPLDYPDADDTDDTESYKDEFSRDGRLMLDTGLIKPLWYDIVDGKKVIKRFGGVNQPMPDI